MEGRLDLIDFLSDRRETDSRPWRAPAMREPLKRRSVSLALTPSIWVSLTG